MGKLQILETNVKSEEIFSRVSVDYMARLAKTKMFQFNFFFPFPVIYYLIESLFKHIYIWNQGITKVGGSI